MGKGWISIHREIQDSWVWKDEPFSKGQAWVDMLLTANHEDKKIYINGKIVTIKRGQFHTSIVKLADRWQWNRKKVDRFLKCLENDSMIGTTRGTTRGTTITIVNYAKFQDAGTTNGTTDGTKNGTKSGQSRGINNNDNNLNKDNNIAPRSFTPYKGHGDKAKPTMFHNGEQNKYDFAELERQLLERDRPQGVEL